MAATLTVANTILAQLGGNRFLAMTGAKSLAGGQNSLSFRIPQARGIRAVVVTLDPSDTYTVKFYGMKKFDVQLKHEQSMVYCDQLQPLFTRITGLETSL